MASMVRSIFVIGEANLANFKVNQTLIRVVIDEDYVLEKDELDYVEDVDCKTTDLCPLADKWLAGSEESGGGGSCTGKSWRIRLSPIVFSCLVYELKKSRNFRMNVLDRIRMKCKMDEKNSLSRFVVPCSSCGVSVGHLYVNISVTWKGPFQLDRIWNYHLEALLHERIELDEMLACLSTLGGAFSSMGDQHMKCAETAGQISVRQMQIAMKLDDVPLIAKCKLFMALSLMQRGHVRSAERVIRAQYALAKSLPENQKDTRLEKMCKGAWAKLQYIHGQKRTRSK